MLASDLHVIAVYSNPRRFQSIGRLLRQFIPRMVASGVRLTVVEHAYGERPWELDKADPTMAAVNLVQVRGGSNQELWIKEALIKLGVRSLPADWKYMAWIDSDIQFVREDWAVETLHMLQHHRVGQPWTHAIDLGPYGDVMRNEWGNDVDRSFAAAWHAGHVSVDLQANYAPKAVQRSQAMRQKEGAMDWRQHFGYAWAIRRETWDAIGGLPDWLVTGSADFHSALAFAGKLGVSEAYISAGASRRFMQYARLCDEHVRQDIGVIPGIVLHGFHGSKKLRQYMTRKEILEESKFDPDVDLVYDWQGIPSLSGDNRLLRDGLRYLMHSRNADDTRVDT